MAIYQVQVRCRQGKFAGHSETDVLPLSDTTNVSPLVVHSMDYIARLKITNIRSDVHED